MRNVRKYTRTGWGKKERLQIRRLPEDDRRFRLTPALERAGYRVPPEVLNREGYVQKRLRQVIEDRKMAENIRFGRLGRRNA